MTASRLESAADNVTRLLAAAEAGEPQASEALLPLVYQELRGLASEKLSHEPPGQTLQPTALVHEAYLRLVGPSDARPQWAHRGHFFAAAAEAMRRILVENARRKQRLRHGGAAQRIDLDDLPIAAPQPDPGQELDLIALDDALTAFERDAPDKAELVKLRYFAGLSEEQAAEALGISRATAARHWAYARAWLFERLSR